MVSVVITASVLALVCAWKSINSSLKTVKQIHIHMTITYNYCRDFGDFVCIHNAHPRFLVLECLPRSLNPSKMQYK